MPLSLSPRTCISESPLLVLVDVLCGTLILRKLEAAWLRKPTSLCPILCIEVHLKGIIHSEKVRLHSLR